MGVDYTANFGIGVRVIRKEVEDDDFGSWLDDKLDGWAYEYISVGCEMYSDEENDLYVILKDPFRHGYNLGATVEEFLAFLRLNDIEYDGKVDVVGGLLID